MNRFVVLLGLIIVPLSVTHCTDVALVGVGAAGGAAGMYMYDEDKQNNQKNQ